MINNMDTLMFLISAIFSIVLVIWLASGNNKVGNYGVGENDSPTTKSPRLPGSSKISYKNVDFNELGVPILKPGTIPMPEVNPLRDDEAINEEDFHNLRKRIRRACDKAGLTYEQALAFLVEYYDIKDNEI